MQKAAAVAQLLDLGLTPVEDGQQTQNRCCAYLGWIYKYCSGVRVFVQKFEKRHLWSKG